MLKAYHNKKSLKNAKATYTTLENMASDATKSSNNKKHRRKMNHHEEIQSKPKHKLRKPPPPAFTELYLKCKGNRIRHEFDAIEILKKDHRDAMDVGSRSPLTHIINSSLDDCDSFDQIMKNKDVEVMQDDKYYIGKDDCQQSLSTSSVATSLDINGPLFTSLQSQSSSRENHEHSHSAHIFSIIDSPKENICQFEASEQKMTKHELENAISTSSSVFEGSISDNCLLSAQKKHSTGNKKQKTHQTRNVGNKKSTKMFTGKGIRLTGRLATARSRQCLAVLNRSKVEKNVEKCINKSKTVPVKSRSSARPLTSKVALRKKKASETSIKPIPVLPESVRLSNMSSINISGKRKQLFVNNFYDHTPASSASKEKTRNDVKNLTSLCTPRSGKNAIFPLSVRLERKQLTSTPSEYSRCGDRIFCPSSSTPFAADHVSLAKLSPVRIDKCNLPSVDLFSSSLATANDESNIFTKSGKCEPLLRASPAQLESSLEQQVCKPCFVVLTDIYVDYKSNQIVQCDDEFKVSLILKSNNEGNWNRLQRTTPTVASLTSQLRFRASSNMFLSSFYADALRCGFSCSPLLTQRLQESCNSSTYAKVQTRRRRRRNIRSIVLANDDFTHPNAVSAHSASKNEFSRVLSYSQASEHVLVKEQRTSDENDTSLRLSVTESDDISDKTGKEIKLSKSPDMFDTDPIILFAEDDMKDKSSKEDITAFHCVQKPVLASVQDHHIASEKENNRLREIDRNMSVMISSGNTETSLPDNSQKASVVSVLGEHDIFLLPEGAPVLAKRGKGWRRSLFYSQGGHRLQSIGSENCHRKTSLQCSLKRPRHSRVSFLDTSWHSTLLEETESALQVEIDMELPIDAKQQVLRLCNQEDVVELEQFFRIEEWTGCCKIGEGVYGEVFSRQACDGIDAVIKLMPIEGNFDVNGEPQKAFPEILSEIIISLELSKLRELNQYNQSSGFVEVLKCSCLKGRYTSAMLSLWDKFDVKKGSENDRPDMFPSDQLFIALEFRHAGQDLESFVFNNAAQALSIFWQVAHGLAVAESQLEFEHRDLHWGNVLVATTPLTISKCTLNGIERNLSTQGVKATIIDFTLSRMRLSQKEVVFNDLAADPSLFTATGDYQFDIYRAMQKCNGNQWENFDPHTNVLWLHYLLDKLLTECHYKNTKSKTHRCNIAKLQVLRSQLLSYTSALEAVTELY